MISLVIYVISFVIIIGIVGSITVFFSNGTKDVNMATGTSSEYNKFNLYMLEYTKNGYEIQDCDKTEKNEYFITFSKSGKSDTFMKQGNILYFNQIKLCQNVDEFQLEQTTSENGKTLLKTYLKINGTVYTTNYAMENIGEVKTEKPITPNIPEGLKVGSTVTYSPKGTYTWQAKYYSSTETGDVILNSANTDFAINEWKVLSIDTNTGKVQMVPSNLTTGTVRLQGAQGYNNGVKLLNEACSSLYSNASKGITARSINIEDIEKVMDPKQIATTKANYSHTASSYSHLNEKEQVSSPYTQSNSYYPLLYKRENLSVIDGNVKNNGLGMSEQTELIERTAEGTTEAKVQANTSIQPYQTYYYMSNNDFATALGDKASILLPKGTSTYYWVASRCVWTGSNYCYFYVRFLYSGNLYGHDLFYSSNNAKFGAYALFPIVSLSSNVISGDVTSGFKID